MTNFFGREDEYEKLKALLLKNSSSLVVMRGRRRIGKSRLAQEFSKLFQKHYFFTGLSPTKITTSASQKKEFRRQMHEMGMASYGAEDWGDLFSIVGEKCASGRVLIVLDEITWMGNKDQDFLGKLYVSWERHFKNNPKLILILSGSNSSWIERNILSSAGFMGRISCRLHLHELPLNVCNRFWGAQTNRISSYEKFKILGITGGIPRYLEEVLPQYTAEENIFRLGFEKSGILYTEFDNIFSDLFQERNKKYREIVKALVAGSASIETIAKRLGRTKGGDLSAALDELVESDFIAQDAVWSIKEGISEKLRVYRLSDNYLRFYLKYIEPNKMKIENNTMKSLPASWLSIMGIQFENLVLNNLDRIIEILKIPPNEVIAAGPYLQTETKTRKKCQIDMLIHTKYNQLYIFENKFSKHPLDIDIIKEVEEKINRIEMPRGFSCRPVAINVNGVTDSLLESEFFSAIIDFSQLLDYTVGR